MQRLVHLLLIQRDWSVAGSVWGFNRSRTAPFDASPSIVRLHDISREPGVFTHVGGGAMAEKSSASWEHVRCGVVGDRSGSNHRSMTLAN